jgi:thioredoxin reductase (NADPH)
VILATGVSYRQLQAPGRPELTGRGVYYGSALTEAACLRQGHDVYIVGGANSAGQAAMYFSRHAKSVSRCWCAALAGRVDVVLPDPADQRAQHLEVRTGTEVDGRARQTTTWSSSPCATPRAGTPNSSTRSGCSCSSARPR